MQLMVYFICSLRFKWCTKILKSIVLYSHIWSSSKITCSPQKDCLIIFLIFQAFYFIAFPSEFLKKIFTVIIFREDKPRPEYFIPIIELFCMSALSGSNDFFFSLKLWLTIHSWSGFWLIFTSLIASHHHPDIYHAGDIPRYL